MGEAPVFVRIDRAAAGAGRPLRLGLRLGIGLGRGLGLDGGSGKAWVRGA